jgi:hypothetical protein
MFYPQVSATVAERKIISTVSANKVHWIDTHDMGISVNAQ